MDKKQSEPVAWRSRWKNHKGEFITGWIVSLTNAENPDPRQVIEPLYTTPQTKPLSDEEIIEIRKESTAFGYKDWSDSLSFARAIEAKVRGEK